MQTELIKWYIILFVCAFMLYSVIEKKVKEVKPFRKKNLIYCIILGLGIGVATLFAYTGLKNFSLYFFIFLQVWLLSLGIIHSHFINKILPWFPGSSFWWQLLFNLMIACVGSILMLFALTALHLSDQYCIMMSSITWFFIPFFFIKSLYRFMSIPKRNLKNWLYPLNETIPPPTDPEMANPVIISFEFQKRNSDPEKTVFRAKAPLAMQMGRLFYYFINDYNERHPGTPIEIASEENKPYGWVYHFKRKWSLKTKYLDPDATISENQVRENSVIVCRRVNES